jgi:hypothetical protein
MINSFRGLARDLLRPIRFGFLKVNRSKKVNESKEVTSLLNIHRTNYLDNSRNNNNKVNNGNANDDELLVLFHRINSGIAYIHKI